MKKMQTARAEGLRHSYGNASNLFLILNQKVLMSESETNKSNSVISTGHGIKLEKAVTILQPANVLYAAWRQIHNLPSIMTHLQSVSRIDLRRSHWVAKSILGTTVEWDAEI